MLLWPAMALVMSSAAGTPNDPVCQVRFEARCGVTDPWREWQSGVPLPGCSGAAYNFVADFPPYAYPQGLFFCFEERAAMMPQIVSPGVPTNWRLVLPDGTVLSEFESLAALDPAAIVDLVGAEIEVGPGDVPPACYEDSSCWSPLDAWAILSDYYLEKCRPDD
ncbi:MAG: hypothetical protein ACI8S6_005342 [Myxococcota bacterium]|jgi:hypothetical protein